MRHTGLSVCETDNPDQTREDRAVADRTHITPALIRQLFTYDAATGILTWNARPSADFATKSAWRTWTTRFAGRVAGCADGFGYIKLNVAGVKVQAHRAVWAYVYDFWPEQVDHINHDRSDNRLANLREVGDAENRKNMGKSKRNSSGVSGVYWDRQLSRWRARIRVNGRTIHLGLFDNLEDAARARCTAKDQYGFHANHGL